MGDQCLKMIYEDITWPDERRPYPTGVVIDEQKPALRYHSGDLVYAEAFEDERLVTRYWSPDGRINYGPERLDGEAFELVANGLHLKRWSLGGMYETSRTERGARHVCIDLKSQDIPLSVTVHTLFAGFPVIVRYLTVRNDGCTPVGISYLQSFSGQLWRGSEFMLGSYARDSWSGEGWLQWNNIGVGHTRIPFDGGINFRHPFALLRNDVSGEYFAFSLQWSGSSEYSFQRDGDRLRFCAGSKSEAMQRVLAPGESYESAALHIAHTSGPLDDLIQAYHAHLRRFVIPAYAPGSDLSIQYLIPADQGFYEFDEETAVENVKIARAIGSEVFILDAYWWDVTCDWEPSRKRFPNGLGRLRSEVRAKGMKFGLYLEMEGGRGNIRESRIYAEHPDWFFSPYDILDISIPEAAAYMEAEICRLIDEYDLGLFRIDYNPAYVITGHGDGNYHEKGGFAENYHSRYYESFYNIYRRVAGKYPDLILQQAALGGGRNDLGTAAVFHENQLTDGLAIPRELQIYAGTTLELPPERLRIVHGADGSHAHLKSQKQDTVMRLSYALGAPTIFSGICAPSLAEFSNSRQEGFRKYAGLFRDFFRPLLQECLVFHHEPVNCFSGVEDSAWFAMEFGAPDKSRGWAVVVRMFRDSGDRFVTHSRHELTRPYGKPLGVFETSPVYTLYPRGLDISKRYKTTFDSLGHTVETSGYELAQTGVRLRLENAGMSELIMFEAI